MHPSSPAPAPIHACHIILHQHHAASRVPQSRRPRGAARQSRVAPQALAWGLLLQLLISFLSLAPALAGRRREKTDAQLLLALKEALTAGDEAKLPTWTGRDPCKKWEGISCYQGEIMGV